MTKRNKEIDLVMLEMEERAWRSAGVIDKHDKKYLEDIYFVDHDIEAYDKAFIDIDRASFSAFFDEANTFDSRMQLLEKWMSRKDDEIKKRVGLLPDSLQKSDQEIFATYDAPMKRARESLLGSMLAVDEFGAEKPKKKYS